MATYKDLVMECDRCHARETLLSNPLPEQRADNDAVRTRMGRWQRLSHSNMSGTFGWDLCPDCWRKFIDEYGSGSKW